MMLPALLPALLAETDITLVVVTGVGVFVTVVAPVTAWAFSMNSKLSGILAFLKNYERLEKKSNEHDTRLNEIDLDLVRVQSHIGMPHNVTRARNRRVADTQRRIEEGNDEGYGE